MGWLRPLFLLFLGGSAAQRSSKRDGIEMRKPKQESIPREDLHKFIWNGEEVSRAPNLFDVGGELKLLPEVLSDLDFGRRNFADNGTPQERKELRDSRPWGRIYVDGWPAPMQYMRSHFGGVAPAGLRPLLLAEPLDACQPLVNNVDVAGKLSPIIMAIRGTCTFTTKVNNTEAIGASGLLIVNNEDGLVHPPGPDGISLATFSAMIPAAEGTVLINAMKAEPMAIFSGVIVPMNCHGSSGIGEKNEMCLPADQTDRKIIRSMSLGGFLSLPSGEKFEYLLAQFGSKPRLGNLQLGDLASADACSSISNAESISGKVIVAQRGNCSFISKAQTVAPGFPSALIIVNNETSLFRMGAFPRWQGTNISFPTILVTSMAGKALNALPKGAPISLTTSHDVNEQVWEDLQQLENPTTWPQHAGKRHAKFEEALQENHNFAERQAAVTHAYNRLTHGGLSNNNLPGVAAEF